MIYSPTPRRFEMNESEFSIVGKAAAGILAVIGGGFGSWQLFKGWVLKGNLTEANSEGNISAIQNLREMLAQERSDHRLAIARLDQFANERNLVLKQLAEMTATLKIQSAKIADQNEQIAALTSEIANLKAGVRA